MRELRVEDALLYLDQVKMEFGDRPHIYNEFLDIMKTFKTQQIDTPGVIRRVSDLFQGNRRLVLGFNTFLPDGYKIEMPTSGDGNAVAVYREPGSNVAHVLRAAEPGGGGNNSQASGSGGDAMGGRHHHGGPPPPPPPPMGRYDGSGGPGQRAGLGTQQQQQHHPGFAGGGGGGGGGRKPAPAGNGRVGPPDDHMDDGRWGMMQAQQQYMSPPRRDLGGYNQPSHHHQQGSPYGPQYDHVGHMVGGPPPPPPPPPGMSGDTPVRRKPGPKPRNTKSPPPPPGRPQQMYHQGPLLPPPPQGQHHMENGGIQQVDSFGSQQPPPQQAGPGAVAAAAQPPMEFDHAINYVTTIKKRFSAEPETYKKFLEILHTYQKEMRGIKEVLEDVSELFQDHPDLLKEFTYFLPDAVQPMAKAQLDQAAAEAEARKRNKATKAIMHQAQGMQRQALGLAVTMPPQGGLTPGAPPKQQYDSNNVPIPFGATQARSLEREVQIGRSASFGVVSFAPVRPPRKRELTPQQAAQKHGRPKYLPEMPRRPNAREENFMGRVREHLSRRELQNERPPTAASLKRQTPYAEFLKCLHLHAAGILNRDEVVLLLRGLFMQGHAPKTGANAGGSIVNPQIAKEAGHLIVEFENILIGRGQYQMQEVARKARSKYGGLRSRDYDFDSCESSTPSYFTYPTDYSKTLFESHPGQSPDERDILNDALLCVGVSNSSKNLTRSIEDYDGVRKRRNPYEEVLQRIEEERFEMDMAIERNAQAMRQIEPLAEECQSLREQEERDGQPIGRLNYQLNYKALNSIHINAIGRLYGEHGDEVIQHLVRNPLIVLPIVFQRLKQKDVEWRKQKAGMMEVWRAGQAANYEGSRDVQCIFKRRQLERSFSRPLLIDECKRAMIYSKHPERIKENSAAEKFLPAFGLRAPDPGALLFQPYAAVPCIVDDVHKDALRLVSSHIRQSADLSNADRERVGRIWAEFVAPWFIYPAHWVSEEVRGTFSGNVGLNVVKFNAGQRVCTIFGDGMVLALTESPNAKYRVKLQFGMAYLSPSAILYAIQSNNARFVRRDGSMTQESAITAMSDSSNPKLDDSYQILFGNENIYLFVRMYALLVEILSDCKKTIQSQPLAVDPASLYHSNSGTDGTTAQFPERLDYSGVVSALLQCVTGRKSLQEFEIVARKVLPSQVHQFAALPKLIERCADALVKTAKEDVLLYLYDYCNVRNADPVAIRQQCLAIEPNALFRIQFDRTMGSLCMSFIAKHEQLLVMPPMENGGTFGQNGDSNVVGMEFDGVGENDPIEDYDDNDDAAGFGPASKRLKLK